MFESFDFQQMISAFIVLFAVIDIIGSIPIIINLKEKGKDVNAMKATQAMSCYGFSMWISNRLQWQVRLLFSCYHWK